MIKVQDRGVDYLYFEFDDGRVEGIAYDVEYAEEIDPTTGEKYQTNIELKRTEKYLMPFDDNRVREMLQVAKTARREHVSLYVRDGDRTWKISNEENFFQPVSWIIEQVAARKSL